MKPFSQACENNKDPILHLLQTFFADRKDVLEVGSGTGQHAVYFAKAMPHLQWQCGDLPENHSGIQLWLDEANLSNVTAPIDTNAEKKQWGCGQFDGIFTANTLHIMSWDNVQRLFQHIDKALERQAKLSIYGPFNYDGQFTSESNANFDQWLKQRAAHQGIRDFEAIQKLANDIGLTLVADNTMPANNRLLLFQR